MDDIPSEQPSLWMMLGAAMALQECGWEGFDIFAMLRGWEMCRSEKYIFLTYSCTPWVPLR
ncbi:hypothetical protein [Prevotella sp. E13-27]|uniref:hypothetical protein n=1 Tax=Prevotella sp. E13-27 TaxID=2938122 RepID=UPI00200B9FD7|nr:hypothetical protein [Prevotella sp. E13-27]MCK8621045.1 hypothetical protein [Prevotella sp. E13-27]